MAASRIFASLVMLAAFAFAAPASATTVYVTSVASTTAQVIINQAAVRTLQIGETSPEGVKLADIQNGVAVLEFDRQVYRMGIGQSTTSQVVVNMARDGQFRLTAHINGVPVTALIDTGASHVSLSSAQARQLGIDYLRGQRTVSGTANGTVATYVVTVRNVQIGGIVVNNVTASVLDSAQAAQSREVLIGNSFLRFVHMQRSGDTMVLTRGNGF